MEDIILFHNNPTSVTVVQNYFIDNYMMQANGEYVKVYLYLLRLLGSNEPKRGLSVSSMADAFDCTEKDVYRALNYWSNQGLLQQEFNSAQKLSGLRLISPSELADRRTSSSSVKPDSMVTVNPSQQSAASSSHAVSTSKQTADTSAPDAHTSDISLADLTNFKKRPEVSELIFVAESYIGRTLNMTDLKMLYTWSEYWNHSINILEFLIESCVSKGHKSFHYMNKIAQEWKILGIISIEEAKKQMDFQNALYYKVCNAFGIKDRSLTDLELNFLKFWTSQLGFDGEMISLACQRTISSIHQPKFEYANTILENWKKNGVHHPEDVKRSDEAFQEKKLVSRKTAATRATAEKGSSSRFNNFNQRNYNYNELEQMLLRQSFQQS